MSSSAIHYAQERFIRPVGFLGSAGRPCGLWMHLYRGWVDIPGGGYTFTTMRTIYPASFYPQRSE